MPIAEVCEPSLRCAGAARSRPSSVLPASVAYFDDSAYDYPLSLKAIPHNTLAVGGWYRLPGNMNDIRRYARSGLTTD